MRRSKQQYRKPEIIDQGSVVNKTTQNIRGECWEGIPENPHALRPCSEEDY